MDRSVKLSTGLRAIYNPFQTTFEKTQSYLLPQNKQFCDNLAAIRSTFLKVF